MHAENARVYAYACLHAYIHIYTYAYIYVGDACSLFLNKRGSSYLSQGEDCRQIRWFGVPSPLTGERKEREGEARKEFGINLDSFSRGGRRREIQNRNYLKNCCSQFPKRRGSNFSPGGGGDL